MLKCILFSKIILGLLFLAYEIYLLTWIFSCIFVSSNIFQSYILCQCISDILPGDGNSKTNVVGRSSCLYGASSLNKMEPFGSKGDRVETVVDFNRCILSAFCVPGTAPGARERAEQVCCHRAYGLVLGSSMWDGCSPNSLTLPCVGTYDWCTRVNREVKRVSVGG